MTVHLTFTSLYFSFIIETAHSKPTTVNSRHFIKKQQWHQATPTSPRPSVFASRADVEATINLPIRDRPHFHLLARLAVLRRHLPAAERDRDLALRALNDLRSNPRYRDLTGLSLDALRAKKAEVEKLLKHDSGSDALEKGCLEWIVKKLEAWEEAARVFVRRDMDVEDIEKGLKDAVEELIRRTRQAVRELAG